MPATTVSARIDSDLKARAEAIMDAIGISHSAAINALYSQIVLRRGMPFELKIPDGEYGENGRALQAQSVVGPLGSEGAAPAGERRLEAGERPLAEQPSGRVLAFSEIRRHVRDLARTYGLQRASLFGSYARGDATADSDVDILVEKGEARGLALGGFQDDLSRVLGKDVDVVSASGASPTFLQRIAEDEVVLYER